MAFPRNWVRCRDRRTTGDIPDIPDAGKRMVFLLKVLKECAGAGPEALALGREARFTQPRRTRVRLRKRAKASGGSFRLGWLLWCLLLGQSLSHEVWRSA